MINIDNYPKSKVKLRGFVGKILKTWVENMSEESVGDITDEYLDSCIPGMLQSNYRILYDFLDENFIYLQPVLMNQFDETAGWDYELSHPGGLTDSTEESHKTRREAEMAGFERSLKILEELL